MTPDLRLLVPAARELLDNWCGPVVLDGYDTVAWWHDGASHIWVQETPDSGYWVGLDMVRPCLDLSRAECRDRVARVLAEAVHRVPKPGTGLSFWSDYRITDRERVWRLSRPARSEADGAGAVFVGRGRPFVPPHAVRVDVPALADLDPDDNARLPDGSRFIDAWALKMVAECVWRNHE